MRELTELEKQWLLSLKHDLMDSDGHSKTNLQAECASDINSILIITKVLQEEN